ncbi:YeeE/YedE thiosulfate transporter family protein [Corynebacterium pseudotuberculosis]|uniref:YeeE/YedE family protein n=1 Tax=Corynebacterium pseudotuberculosis (strain C231) TaxID=681645 RepID=D9QBU6_CORP2|nr:YeeE/YedE thiosulfate transporter family protein [Corynebacterium pseudotuberculosis]ADL11022.1 YeeE/YedE family protein [Corynebacterium pseudotuberculosis C231]AEK92886.1 Hypothetical protein, YeeE/YedE family [Corynebacterium pseudotuberculosis PAT10]AEP70791.1 Hypothetical protein, YeeE/YedE family [Corynebacterium pseudotuberculosis 42/02-A]QGX53144.1 YeeE/YedE family protein [Corynebacterium pseudotuberculosis]QHI74980.1 YeeE/YedE family protein [Corynebacterium pseudotuberculosis]
MIATGLLLGAVLGVVLQRGRFCVTGMLRDIYLLKTWRGFVALLIVISVHAVGLSALRTLGVITTPVDAFAPLAVVIGGFIFGIGIVLAGGCAPGTWYRSGEGLVGSWFALLFYGISAAAMKTGILHGGATWLKGFTINATTIPDTFGLSPWWFAIGLSLLTVYSVWYYRSKDGASVATLGRTGWKRPLSLNTAGLLVGILGVIAWPLSAATGRNDGLGITTPTAHLTSWLTTGDAKFLNWGTLLVVGILVGSFASAKATGEFRVRVPDATTSIRSIAGGTLMGIGAALAGGCTVGNGMVQTSLFSYQGWVALLFIGLGVAAAAKAWLKPTQKTRVNSTFEVAPAGVKVGVDKQGLRAVAPGTYVIDTLGAVCPFPLIDAKTAINQLSDGEALVIDFDCTQATETIPRWAADDGHAVTDFHEVGSAGWQITVVKHGALLRT